MDGSLLVVAFLIGLGVLAAALWMAAVIYVFVDASNRRAAHPFLWAFGTFWTGPVGFIAYLIDRPKAEQRTCSFCGHTILRSDAHCPYCGRLAP